MTLVGGNSVRGIPLKEDLPDKVYRRTRERLARVTQLYDMAKHAQEIELKSHKFNSSDFTSHLCLEACVAFGAGAWEYYAKNILRWSLDLPRNLAQPARLRVRTTADGFVAVQHRFTRLYVYEKAREWFMKLLGIDPSVNLDKTEVAFVTIYCHWRHLVVHNNAEIDVQFLEETKAVFDSHGLTFGQAEGTTFLLHYQPVGSFLDALGKLIAGVNGTLPDRGGPFVIAGPG